MKVYYFYMVIFLFCTACNRDKTSPLIPLPEVRELFISKDSMPYIKLIIERHSAAGINSNIGKEYLLIKASSVAGLIDSTGISLRIKKSSDILYSKTFEIKNLTSEQQIDSIILQNYNADIGIYQFEAGLNSHITLNLNGTYEGFVLIDENSIIRYKPFQTIVDNLGNIITAIEADSFISVQAGLYKDSMLVGKIFHSSDTMDINYLESKVKFRNDSIFINLNFNYQIDTNSSSGTLNFTGTKK